MLIETLVRRPTTLDRSYCETNASAAVPSGVDVSSTPRIKTASIARKTSLGMVKSPGSLQRHNDADEVNAEGRLYGHNDTHLARDFLGAGCGDVEEVSRQGFVL